MIEIHGINGLRDNLWRMKDDNFWIYTKSRSESDSVQTILNAIYFIPEDMDESDEVEITDDVYFTFLDTQTFEDVVTLEKEAGRETDSDIAEGCLYYLIKDTYRD